MLFPFEVGPFALRMGVHPLSQEAWIDLNRDALDSELELKRRLLSNRYREVVAVVDRPEVIDACAELDRLVVDWWVGSGQPSPEPDPAVHPIVAASLRTQEDWCILDGPAGEPPLLVAGCVCFPTRWILAEKLGLPSSAIHAPVALYDRQLASPVDRFLQRLRPEAAVWRANWNLVDDAELCQAYLPAAGRRLECTPATVGDLVHLRVERQTLRRLPDSGAIAFGIRVHQHPLRELESEPDVLARLLTAVDGLPPETFAYKGLAAFWPELRTWLTGVVDG